MSTPAISVASGITTVFSWRAQPALSIPSLEELAMFKRGLPGDLPVMTQSCHPN
jgi:hypothetical protein